MIRLFGFLLLAGIAQHADAQRLLSLDSCRALALRNNKQISVSRVKQEIARNLRKSARTKYLPHVNAIGAYEFTSKEISLLSNDHKAQLNNMGTTLAGNLQQGLGQAMADMPASAWMAIGEITGKTPQELQQSLAGTMKQGGDVLNAMGSQIVDALHTDTRHLFAGSIMVTQPIFMGGAIVALNKLASIGEQMAANSAEAKRQQTLYTIDQTYWQVVSLHHKRQLAQAYYDLVSKLEGDVQKMIKEGVATRSDGLSVSVKVNEAQMALTQVEDGLTLSRMLLCQLCGLPVDEQVTLADEAADDIVLPAEAERTAAPASVDNRPELKMLQNVVDMTRQTTNILRAGNLPQVLLTGGYAATNPNLFNSFQRKFGGFWNVGVMVRVPIWNWGDVMYKVRASKGATTIAQLEMQDAREKMELQLSQSRFRVGEANKKLQMAQTNIVRAEENLRTANVGFREGVISTTTVMEAQTAWLLARSQKIDAEIDVKLSQVNLQKAMGALR